MPTANASTASSQREQPSETQLVQPRYGEVERRLGDRLGAARLKCHRDGREAGAVPQKLHAPLDAIDLPRDPIELALDEEGVLDLGRTRQQLLESVPNGA